MLRAYLLIVVTIGIAASVLSSRGSAPQRERTAHDVHVVGPAEQADTSTAPMVANVDGSVQLQRNENGHFYADVDINGATIHMLVDTGATGVALSREDARRAGIATSIGMTEVVGQGADGNVHGEFVMVDRISLGSKSVEQMPAMVLNGGEQSLLGQAFLAKFASVEIHGDTMILR
jgi:clan AA aspartic protease (TIGR02281 family)